MRCLALVVLLLAGGAARAQIDDRKRLQLEAGYEQGLGNPGPLAPYLFVYLNHPGVLGSSSTLRMAIAPVYVDSELGLRGAMGPDVDAGLGFSGGGYAFGQTEVRRGDDKQGESFTGHGGGPSLSLYPRLGALGPVPLNGYLKIATSYADYRRVARTDPAFVLPPNEWTATFRGGLRFGGQEPGLDKSPAMEASLWAEHFEREHGGAYGYGDRVAQKRANLYWSRLLFAYTLWDRGRLGAGFSAGGGVGVDRFSAYRLGGMTTLTSEFPLIIPGYFPDEIAAREYAHLWLRQGVPLDASRKVVLNVIAAGASVAPAPGTDPGGALHAGVGLGLEFVPRRGALRVMTSYGYAPTAARGGGRGGQALALGVEVDFAAPAGGRRGRLTPTQEGLRWLLGPVTP